MGGACGSPGGDAEGFGKPLSPPSSAPSSPLPPNARTGLKHSPPSSPLPPNACTGVKHEYQSQGAQGDHPAQDSVSLKIMPLEPSDGVKVNHDDQLQAEDRNAPQDDDSELGTQSEAVSSPSNEARTEPSVPQARPRSLILQDPPRPGNGTYGSSDVTHDPQATSSDVPQAELDIDYEGSTGYQANENEAENCYSAYSGYSIEDEGSWFPEEVQIGQVENPSSDDNPYPPGYAPPIPTGIVGTYSTHGLMPQPEGPPVKVNQDFGTTLYPLAGNPRYIMFTVCDGHGSNGDQASKRVAEELNASIEAGIMESAAMAELLPEAFQTAQNRLKMDSALSTAGDFEVSGTTVVVVIICRKKMWMAHAGDSRAVLARKDGSILQLTGDHNVTLKSEYTRIFAHGGEIRKYDDEAPRVVAYNETGQMYALGMSRSVGDLCFTKVGVTHEPTVSSRTIEHEDEWIIMASDGIWEFITNREAVEIVRKTWDEHKSATMCTRALINKAKDRWFEMEKIYRDDITVTMIHVPHLLIQMKRTMKGTSPKMASRGGGSPSLAALTASPMLPGSLGSLDIEHQEMESVMLDPPVTEAEDSELKGSLPSQNLGMGMQWDSTALKSQNLAGSRFMRRHASALLLSINPEDLMQAPLDVSKTSASCQESPPSPRDLSLSPELDMNLWKFDELGKDQADNPSPKKTNLSVAALTLTAD